jgi:hypothetical protein
MTDQQLRARNLAMNDRELAEFLRAERTCRVATMSGDGPRATPLWFLWDGSALWLSSLVRSKRHSDLRADPRIAVVVDAGHDFTELRGAEIIGDAAVVGESPRTGTPDTRLDTMEHEFAAKYLDSDVTELHAGTHAWLCVTPRKIVSWDFRKLGNRG